MQYFIREHPRCSALAAWLFGAAALARWQLAAALLFRRPSPAFAAAEALFFAAYLGALFWRPRRIVVRSPVFRILHTTPAPARADFRGRGSAGRGAGAGGVLCRG